MASGAPGHFGVTTSMDAGPIVRGLNQIDRASQNTAKQLQGINNTTRQIATGLPGVFNRSAQELIFLGLDLQQLGRSLALLSAPFIAADIAAAKFTIDFQDSLGNINALIQVSDTQLVALGERLRNLALDPQVVQGPIELAEALRFLLSSGFDTANAFGVLRTASIGATAGNADLTTVTRTTAGVLNALPRGTITAAQAMDTMFQTVKDGIVEFSELSGNLGEILGVLGATGVSFKEAGAAIATLTRAGIPVDETMTSINRVLTSFIAPSAQATKLAGELGIEFSAAALRSRGLGGALEDVVKATGGSVTQLRVFFDEQRAFRGALALSRNGLQDYNQLLENQQHASDGAGAAQLALEQALKKPGVQLQLLKRDLQNAGIAMGQEFLPVIVGITKVIRDLALGFATLDPNIQRLAAGLGIALAASSALAFGFGALFSGVGAIKNLFKLAHGDATKLAGALREVAVASTAVNAASSLGGLAGAGGVAAGAARQAAVARATARPIVIPLPATDLKTLERQALQANAAIAGIEATSARVTSRSVSNFRLLATAIPVADLRAVDLAAKSAGFSFGALLGTVGKVAVWGLVVGAIVEATNALLDFAAGSRVADKSTGELLDRLSELKNQKPPNLAEQFAPSAIPGVGVAVNISRFLEDREQQKIKEKLLQDVEPLAKFSIQQAEKAQQQAAEAAAASFPQTVADLDRKIAAAAEFPELQKKIQEAQQRLLTEGPSAITESGFSTLGEDQQRAVTEELNRLETVAVSARISGLPEIENDARAEIERIQKSTGFELQVPVRIKEIAQDELDKIQQQRFQLEADARVERRPITRALDDLEKQQRADQLAQQRLNLEMMRAQAAFKIAQRAVEDLQEAMRETQDVIDDLKRRIGEAEDRIGNLGQTREFGIKFVLQGLPEIENAIFNIGQQVAAINLQILNVQAGFTPGIFDAQEEVLRTRLALLLAGDAAEDLGKKASFGIDDLISAQQRELREGVPVLRTIFDKIRAAEAGEGGGQEESPEEKANKAAQKRLEILQIEQQLATIQLQKQLEIAQQEERRLQLTKQITFDPQIRELEQLVTTTKEISFEEAKAAIIASREEMGRLNEELSGATVQLRAQEDELAAANAILLDRQGIVEGLQQREADLQEKMLGNQITMAELQGQLADIEVRLRQANDDLAIREDAFRAIQNTTAPTQRWSSDVGNDYPIPFTTEQQQESNTQIRAIQQNTAASLQLMDSAAGGIAEILLRLLATIGMAGSGTQLAGVFHEGGRVQGLTPGIEVPARLLVGEHVLSRGQVHVLRSAGIDPSHVHELVGAIRSLPRYHEGGPVAMVSAPAVSPMSSSPMALPSGGSSWNWAVTINNSGGGDVYGKFMREVYSRRLGGRWR